MNTSHLLCMDESVLACNWTPIFPPFHLLSFYFGARMRISSAHEEVHALPDFWPEAAGFYPDLSRSEP